MVVVVVVVVCVCVWRRGESRQVGGWQVYLKKAVFTILADRAEPVGSGAAVCNKTVGTN